ncbi:GAF domain-containing protein [bacterium]|nr:GAF domain-containing protein [bacterium]
MNAPVKTVKPSIPGTAALKKRISNLEKIIGRYSQSEKILQARVRLFQFAMTHSLDELLEETLNEVEQLTESTISFYHFVNPDQKTLTLQNWSSRTKMDFCRAQGKGAHYEISKAGVWVDCVYQRKPVIHNDYASLPHKKGLPPGHARVIRELVVPVLRDDKIMAILGVGNKPTDYNDEDVRIVSLFADLVWDAAERKRSNEALETRERELLAIYDLSPVAMILMDHERQVRRVNRTAADYSDRQLTDMTGLRGGEALRCLHAMDDPRGCGFGPSCKTCRIRATVEETYKTGQAFYQVDVPFQVLKNGKITEKNLLISTQRIEIQEARRVLVCVDDITERRQAEKALENSMREMKCLVDISRLAEQTGLSIEEFILGAVCLLPSAWQNPDHCGARIRFHAKVFKSPGYIETRWKETADIKINGRKCGDISVCCPNNTMAAVPDPAIRDKKELITTLAEFMGHIIQHRQSEIQLREQELLLRAIADNFPNAYLSIIEKDMSIGFTSGREYKKRGLDPEFHAGRTLKEVFKNQTDTVKSHYLETFQGKETEFELTIRDRHFLIKAVPLYDEHGEVQRLLSVMENITERKRAEEKLKTSLREKDLLLRELYHRTKNNMQVISSMLRLRAQWAGEPKISGTFKEIENKIMSMALVHEKLYESKDLSHLNLKDYIESLISLIKRGYREQMHAVTIQTRMKDVHMQIDIAVPLGLVINELITNSVKHAFPESRPGIIRVRLRLNSQKMLVLEISDNGTGLPNGFDMKRDVHLGMKTIFDLIEIQLDGRISFFNRNGLHCRLILGKELYQPRL